MLVLLEREINRLSRSGGQEQRRDGGEGFYMYPIRDVTVSGNSLRFCSVRFGTPSFGLVWVGSHWFALVRIGLFTFFNLKCFQC